MEAYACYDKESTMRIKMSILGKRNKVLASNTKNGATVINVMGRDKDT